MILPDANVLVGAFHKDAPGHAESRRWLEESIRSEAAFGISDLVLSGSPAIGTSRDLRDLRWSPNVALPSFLRSEVTSQPVPCADQFRNGLPVLSMWAMRS